jgi:hypothetical protein
MAVSKIAYKSVFKQHENKSNYHINLYRNDVKDMSINHEPFHI